MAYTVKKLRELSGVSVRTLHFYEEEDLLKPSYYGSNGYRYYEEKELLQLQQILFFKALGFTLKQIKKVLGRSDFDQLAALHSHRKALSQEWEKIGLLIRTVDKTIKHLQGKKKMKDAELFEGFKEWAKGKGGESYFIGHLDKVETDAEKLILKNVKKQPDAKDFDKSYWEKIEKETSEIYSKIAKCIDKGLNPISKEVQLFIKEHSDFADRYFTITKEVYKALSQVYKQHPAYRKQLEHFHPKLADFMSEAMKNFADRELS